MQLLVPDNLVSIAARVLCTDKSYCITEPGPAIAWCSSASRKVRRRYLGPKAWGHTFTVCLAHTSPEEVEGQYWGNPMEILIHPQSSFHFDVWDASRTCLNSDPPSSDLAAVRYPTWPAFFDMVVDTRFQPPVELSEISSHLRTCEGYLVMYSLSDIEGALFENEPFHGDHHTFAFTRLLPRCWQALEEVKDENKLCLARSLLGPKGAVGYETLGLERYLVKQGISIGKGLQPPLYPAGITSEQVPVFLRKLQASYGAQKPTFDMLYHKWPRLFRHLPKF